jgi:hypothetical protein
VNDEESSVEFALLDGQTLTFEGRVLGILPGTESLEEIRGKQPVERACERTDKHWTEFDGEGIATDGEWVYVSGSHSCSRGGKYKPSSFLVTRFVPTSPEAMQWTWRLGDMIRESPEEVVRLSYGRPKGVGANVEGIAVFGGRLYVGLRTPTDDGDAFILSASIEALFEGGHTPLVEKTEVIRVRLGRDAGIRDLAATRNGLLVLAGPTGDQKVEYGLWSVPLPPTRSSPQRLGGVTTPSEGKGREGTESAKAEAAVVLEETEESLTVLVLYDNIDEGGPRLHVLPKASQARP